MSHFVQTAVYVRLNKNCLSAREICPVSQPVFFGKYHLQAWYISIIPPNMWLSLPEDKSREHRNVKILLFLITIYF
jgi:hypothetical protein